MANFNANLITPDVLSDIMNSLRHAERYDGSCTQTDQKMLPAQVLQVYASDCPYWGNPGFVCPLSVYRVPGLFFANG